MSYSYDRRVASGTPTLDTFGRKDRTPTLNPIREDIQQESRMVTRAIESWIQSQDDPSAAAVQRVQGIRQGIPMRSGIILRDTGKLLDFFQPMVRQGAAEFAGLPESGPLDSRDKSAVQELLDAIGAVHTRKDALATDMSGQADDAVLGHPREGP